MRSASIATNGIVTVRTARLTVEISSARVVDAAKMVRGVASAVSGFDMTKPPASSRYPIGGEWQPYMSMIETAEAPYFFAA
ncbi:MAG: hypothetical protein AAF724_07585 [Pseudomonadota bacterium]